MYWLGRYLQRVEAILYQIDKAFDQIIDVDKSAGVQLYQKLGISIEYTNAEGFLKSAICGEHPANLATIMNSARESAIISRSNINASAFGEIIALEGLFRKLSGCTLPVDYKDIDDALSLLREIWGAYTSRGHQKRSDYFLKLGKLVEEVDLRLRFDKNLRMTRLILEDINNMFNLISPDLDICIECPKNHVTDAQENIREHLYKAVDTLIIHD